MITQFTSKLTRYYQISLVLVIFSILATVLYFWKLGFIDGSKGKELHRVSFILEEIEQKGSLNEVKAAVWDENPKMAILKLEQLEQDLAKVDSIVSYEEFENIQKTIQAVKKDASALISFPKANKIIAVFNDKMNKFHDFVDQKRWQTLTRMSDRVLNRSKGHIAAESIGSFAKSVENEFEQMEKITENSILPRADKQEIISRLNNLKVETGMLRKYVSGRKKFDKQFKVLGGKVNNWLNSIRPEVTYQKLQMEQIGRTYIIGLLGILLFNMLIFFGSFLHNRWAGKKVGKEFEKKFKHLISNNILGQGDEGLEGASEDFVNFAIQTGNYINKRMNFGSVFQEALPLASVLLDSNLKVVWANQHFLNQWDIPDGDISKEHLSWDYLVKMTNIGDDDPVLEALKNNIAGIYQVQIKCQQENEIRPFEMYVSPVTFNHRTRIMLFFYSLVSLQDTIKDQAKSIVTPINKSLDLLINQRYEELTKNNFGKEFEIGGIEFIQDKFIALRDQIIESNAELTDELEYLQAHSKRLEEICLNASEQNQYNLEVAKQQVDSLKEVKDWIIQLSEVGKTFESISGQSEQLLHDVFANLDEVSQGHAAIGTIAEQMIYTFPKLDSLKDEFRTFKNDVVESKNRLSHSITQFCHFKRKINDPILLERFVKTYERVGIEFKALEEATNALDKKITSLEVMFSKSKLLVSDLEEKLAPRLAFNAGAKTQQLLQQFETLKHANAINQGLAQRAEQEVVTGLTQLYQYTKQGFKATGSVANCFKEIHFESFEKTDSDESDKHSLHDGDKQYPSALV